MSLARKRFFISFLMESWCLLEMGNVFRFMLIAHPESRIAEVVGRCCRVDVLWELLSASTSVAP